MFKGFPKSWLIQHNIDKALELKEVNEYRTKYKFKSHLPGCIGFHTTTGEVVMYGREYKRLLDEGRIV